jgi:hypothetical protein
MKVAVLFRGISYVGQYTHWSKERYHIDFRDNIENVKRMLLNPLKRDHDVDVYYSTYEHDLLHILSHELEPIKISIQPEWKLHRPSSTYVLDMMYDVMSLVPSNYDLIVLARFDVSYKDSIDVIPYNRDKINFLCEASGKDKTIIYNDDTLLIMKGTYINLVKNVIKDLADNEVDLGHHRIYSVLKSKIPNKLNMIYTGAFEIAKERPLCVFNRELQLSRDVLSIESNNEIPYVCFKHGQTCLQNTQKHSFVLFKPPDVEEIVYIPVNRTDVTQVCLQFTIKSLGQSVHFCLVCNEIVKKFSVESKSILSVKENVVIKRTDVNNVHLLFNKPCVHVEISDVRIEDTEYAKIHFVSFYTQGPPLDSCLNMTNTIRLYEKRIGPYVDSVRLYTPSELAGNEKTSTYVQKYTNGNPYNPGVHQIGFLKWKPYIILQSLKECAEGDIVFYRDGNVVKYPNILDEVEKTRELVEYVLAANGTDVFVPVENYPTLKMKKNVKREIFEALGEYTSNYTEAFGYNTSIVICRKSKLSLKLMEDWLKGCMDDRLIDFETRKQQHPDFGWNVQEQSILNVLLHRYVCECKLPPTFPLFSLNNRSFSFDKLTKIPRVAVLIVGELRNYTDPVITTYNNKNLFERMNCDVFVSCWDKQGFSFNHGHYTSKGYASTKVSESEIMQTYGNVKGINIENHDAWFDMLDESSKTLYRKGFFNNNNKNLCPLTTFPQLYKLWDANRLKCEYEHRNDFKYDIVIKFRGDMCMIESIPDEYLFPLVSIKPNNGLDKLLYHLNPPNIYEPNRIYDVFFYGSSTCMDNIAEAWNNIHHLIHNPFDNGLAKVNPCRVLYIQALQHDIKVHDIPLAMGDIYRDEGVDEFKQKLAMFNQQSNKFRIDPTVQYGRLGRCLRGNASKFLR